MKGTTLVMGSLMGTASSRADERAVIRRALLPAGATPMARSGEEPGLYLRCRRRLRRVTLWDVLALLAVQIGLRVVAGTEVGAVLWKTLE